MPRAGVPKLEGRRGHAKSLSLQLPWVGWTSLLLFPLSCGQLTSLLTLYTPEHDGYFHGPVSSG